MKLGIRLKPEIIVEHNGFVIRSLRDTDYIIAIPKDVTAYMHRLEKGETIKEAIERVKEIIK